jgi:hypothetical protein
MIEALSGAPEPGQENASVMNASVMNAPRVEKKSVFKPEAAPTGE